MNYPRWIEVSRDSTGLYTITISSEMQTALKSWWERRARKSLKDGEKYKPYNWFDVTFGADRMFVRGYSKNCKLNKNKLRSTATTIEVKPQNRFRLNEKLDKMSKSNITSNCFLPHYGVDDYIIELRYDLRAEGIGNHEGM